MRKAVTISIILLAVLLGVFFYVGFNYEGSLPEAFCEGDNCVVRVIDGDTFILGNNESVRLLCVNAPEIGKVGSDEAAAFLSSLIEGREVRLERDVSDRDKYGRLLRYVYVNVSSGSEEQELFVNRELVHEGFAEVYIYGDDVEKCREIGE